MIDCRETIRQLWEYLDSIVDAADRRLVEGTWPGADAAATSWSSPANCGACSPIPASKTYRKTSSTA